MTRFFLTTLGLVAAISCSKSDDLPQEPSSDAPSDALPGVAPQPEQPAAAPVVHIPVGKFLAGSQVGQPGRDPELEPLARHLKLGPFRIDAEPYRDAGALKLGLQRDEAAALCAQRSGRLCTELEWERACHGTGDTPYPEGDRPVGDEVGESSFGVRGLGARLEWTSSQFGKGSPNAGMPVLRGASADTPRDHRQCARRRALEDVKGNNKGDEKVQDEVGFRCCYGAPNAAKWDEPTLGAAFKEVDVTNDELKRLLESDEATKFLVEDLKQFKEDAAATVFSRGPGETMGFTLTTRGVEWQPERGTKLLVLSGMSGEKTAFVVAYFLGGDEKKLAGSFIMKNERGPIALAYAPSIRPRMHFSGCWGCPGETGKLLFRPPERIVLLQP